MAQLHRTIALMQMHQVAMMVGQHLHFDVPWPRHQFFHKYCAITKRCAGLALTTRQCFSYFFHPRNRTHASATTASSGLEHDRIAQCLRKCLSVLN